MRQTEARSVDPGDSGVLLARSTVLVVDDTRANIIALERFLGRTGCKVLTAESGAEAINLARDHRPDLILLDVRMPEMDGFSTCVRLKSDSDTAEIPVIFVTACAEEDAARGFEVGAVDYLIKPVNTAELLARITTHLSLAAARARLEEDNEELRRLNAEISMFSSMVAHDLKAPLRRLSSQSERLARELEKEDGGKAREISDRIGELGVSLMKLVGDILAFARSGGQIKLAEVSLAEVCGEALSRLQTDIETAGAGITVADLPMVQGDRALLVQVFQNLVGNAIAYAGETPQVLITSRSPGAEVEVIVADNGPGIEEKLRPQVFVTFNRGERAGSDGTGLGLAICKRVVNRHGGRIWIEDSESGGAAFHFTLPAETA